MLEVQVQVLYNQEFWIKRRNIQCYLAICPRTTGTRRAEGDGDAEAAHWAQGEEGQQQKEVWWQAGDHSKLEARLHFSRFLLHRNVDLCSFPPGSLQKVLCGITM